MNGLGLDSIAWTDVQVFLSEFFGSSIIAQGAAAIVALGLGRFALNAIINAFRR